MHAGVRTGLAALGEPAFRRFLLEDAIGGSGLFVLQISLAWTVLQRTGSGAIVGLLQTALLLPIPLAIVVAGSLTDRFGPRRLMIGAWFAMGAVSAAFALMNALGALDVPAVLVLMAILGFFDGMYVVPSQVLVGRAVDPRLMANAIGLSSLTVGIGRVIGGPLGGIALAALGPTRALAIAAVTCAVAGSVCTRLPELAGFGGRTVRPWEDVGGTLEWIRGSRPSLLVVLLGCAAAAFVYCYLAVTPLVVRDLLHGGSAELGLLTAAGGVGAIAAAVSMDWLGKRLGRARLLLAALVAGGLSVAFAGLVSGSTVTFTATAILLLQATAPARVRGRTLAVYNALFYAVLPVSEASAGAASDRLGVGAVLIGAGILAIGAACAVRLLAPAFAAYDVDSTGRASTARAGVG